MSDIRSDLVAEPLADPFAGSSRAELELEELARAGLAREQIYSAPTLIRYGDVREITQALNTLMGNPDGMMIGPLVLKTGGF